MTFQRRQRSIQHQAAHDVSTSHQPPLNHPLVPQGAPDLLADDARLAEFAQHVRTQGTFAFDTEFIGEDSYRPRTCLIQLATSKRVALIDPLAIKDVTPVWELIGDPAIVTILHAGASDLSPARRHLKRDPPNLIDVQVGAGFVGMGYPSSLAKLVERFAGHVIDKGHTFTNWDARPLSPSQLRYAADDVRYLPLVWNVMKADLEKRGRLEWALKETMARLEDPHVFDAKAQVRRTNRGFILTPPQEKLLEALCILRDEIAQHEDLPTRTTIPDGSLLEIIRDRPKSKQALNAVRGLPSPVVMRHGDLLLKTLADHPGPTTRRFMVKRWHGDRTALKDKTDALMVAVDAACKELEIAPMLAITRADLERYVRQVLEGSKPAADLFDGTDWRRAAFGDRFEKIAKARP